MLIRLVREYLRPYRVPLLAIVVLQFLGTVAMGALRADRTSFVIAHRLSTIRDADLILVMDHRFRDREDDRVPCSRGSRDRRSRLRPARRGLHDRLTLVRSRRRPSRFPSAGFRGRALLWQD